MKIRALVVGDQITHREATRDFPARSTRQLLLVDQDDTPMESMLTLTIPMDDPVSPADKGAPSLQGQVVTAAIRKWTQYEGDKRHVLNGHLVRVEGIMRFEAAPEPKPTKAA